MKKENIYLDLSKLSVEEIKEIPNILKKGNQELYFLAEKTIESGKLDNYYKYLVFAKSSINIWVFSHDKPKRIEISLSEFRQLFSEGEEVLQVENNVWIEVNNSLPLCTSTGDWDGKQSDIILAETITGKKFLAQCYEGFMDGSEFFDWYQVDEINQNDWLINESVSRWMKIPF